MCDPRIKVGEQSDEWLLRKNVFVLGAPHGALSPWGALPVGRKINFFSFNSNAPKT